VRIEIFRLDADYIMRKTHTLPKQGDRQPWIFSQGDIKELNEIRHADLSDGTLIYETRTESSLASQFCGLLGLIKELDQKQRHLRERPRVAARPGRTVNRQFEDGGKVSTSLRCN
ncbi:MAG: hypothetical protein AAFO17_18255, partial [Pseudomonadota bacterium]